MKNLKSKIFAFLAVGILFSSCEENAIVEQTEYVTSGANIRFSVATQAAPMVNFFLNDQKITAKSAVNGRETGLVWATTIAPAMYPATYGYANVPSGSYTLSAVDTTTVPGTNTLAMNKILTTTVQLDEMSNYTTYLLGTTGNLELLTLRDELPPYDFSKAHVRFVNAMTGAPENLKLVAIRTAPTTETIAVGSNVPFKGESGYVAITPGTYNIAVSLQGSSTAYTTWTGGIIDPGRVYTFVTRGAYTATPTTMNRQAVRER